MIPMRLCRRIIMLFFHPKIKSRRDLMLKFFWPARADLVSDAFDHGNSPMWTKRATLQGVGSHDSVIRLCHHADKFQDATAPRPVLPTFRAAHQSGIVVYGVTEIAALFASVVARPPRSACDGPLGATFALLTSAAIVAGFACVYIGPVALVPLAFLPLSRRARGFVTRSVADLRALQSRSSSA